MMRRLVVIAILLLNGTAWGQAPPPLKEVPWVKVPEVAPPPAPQPIPGAVPRLGTEELYVLDCSEPCFVLVSPPGIVAVSQDAGPLRIRGKFVGGNGKYETKTFTGKMVFTVEAVGTGRVELLVVKEGAKSPADVFRQHIDANTGPLPPPVPPGPTPPVPPDPPKPDPAPIPAPGLRVLIVYETADLAKLTAGQRAILYSAKVRAHLDSVCVKGPDARTAEWRLWDQNVDASGESVLWQNAMKRARASLPWVVISNPGKGGYEGPLPDGTEAFLTLVKKYESGGE